MNFEPRCKEQADLYEQMARVLRMCKEAGFDRPWECVKVRGYPFDDFPLFNDNPKYYEFFLCFIEGRPVLRGDVLYEQKGIGGVEFTATNTSIGVMNGNCRYLFMPEDLSWTPPQRTIEINGVKVKAHTDVAVYVPRDNSVVVNFQSPADAEAFKAALDAPSPITRAERIEKMCCDICGSGSCSEMFHSLEEQERYAPAIELFEKARELRNRIDNEIQEKEPNYEPE